jgi:hypothetical protein
VEDAVPGADSDGTVTADVEGPFARSLGECFVDIFSRDYPSHISRCIGRNINLVCAA